MEEQTKGLFISFEGGEGAGKSTHLRFLSKTLEDRGYEVVLLREPGGTVIGEAMRAIVLDPSMGDIAPETELLLYETARAQLVSSVIRPALERGAIVLCDRFTDSTLAYQAFGRGLPLEEVKRLNAFACQGLVPDRTILMTCDAPAEVGLERATHSLGADRLEMAGADFHARVNDAFLKIAEHFPERIRIVSSAEKKSSTAQAVFAALSDLFPWMVGLLADPGDFFASLDVKTEK